MLKYDYKDLTVDTCANFYKFGGLATIFDADTKEVEFTTDNWEE